MTEKNVKRRADILRLITGGIDGSKGHDTNDKYIVFLNGVFMGCVMLSFCKESRNSRESKNTDLKCLGK